MPTHNVYLSDLEYAKLADLAMERNEKISTLIRQAVQKFLREVEKK